MRDKLKERLQCRDCKIPYCDALCTDLSDEQIDWIMELADQRVIEELDCLEEKIPKDYYDDELLAISKGIRKRIKELKQV